MKAKKITPEELEKIEREYREVEASIPDDPEMPPEEPIVIDTPEQPTVVEETKPEVENINNNGHGTISELEKTELDKQRIEELEQIRKFEEEEEDKSVPGHGYLVNVKDKFLDQSTRLNEREIFLFSVGEMQEQILNTTRTETAYNILIKSIMRKKISRDGKGREETLDARQQEAEKAAQSAAKGALLGRP